MVSYRNVALAKPVELAAAIQLDYDNSFLLYPLR